ncbi:MAG: type II and III secretion system protein, partial [Candidatus Omnitrophota bacterium]
KQVSDTRVIARPRLMVTNNEEANIHIGDTIPYVTSTTTGTGDTATVSEQINFIDVGIKLKVKPTINDEGFVTMKVRPEISSRTKDVTTPQGALIPQVNTTFVETVSIVKDGYTVIIGGLKQVQNTNSTKGLPGMMDMPVAGAFFRNEAKNLMDSEIAIFLTPHIVTGKQNVIDEKNEVLPNQPYTPGSEAGAAKTEIKGVNKKDGNTAIAA